MTSLLVISYNVIDPRYIAGYPREDPWNLLRAGGACEGCNPNLDPIDPVVADQRATTVTLHRFNSHSKVKFAI